MGCLKVNMVSAMFCLNNLQNEAALQGGDDLVCWCKIHKNVGNKGFPAGQSVIKYFSRSLSWKYLVQFFF